MINKKRIGIVLFCLVVLSTLWLSGCNMIESLNRRNISRKSSDSALAEKYDEVLEKLELLESYIDNYYYFEDDADVDKMIEGIYAGLVDGLNEPYSTYYSPEEYQRILESIRGTYSGIGVMVSQNANTGIITVVRPFENGPGFEAGIEKDDIIYKVNGEEVTGVDINDVVAQIKGEEGTTVDITLYRQYTNEYIDITVARRKVETPTIEHKMLEDNIGYILISEFEEVTVEQFKSAVSELEAAGMEGLIIDVRDNPGGSLDSVCEILNRLLPEGLLVYTLDREGNRIEKYADDEEVLDLPIVVLMNGNSASASEIFAAALHDYEWATLIGTTTFGKGIVQSIIPLGDGSAIKLTTSQYYPPQGADINGKGVDPDMEVEFDREYEGDNQLDKALDEMKNMISK